MITYKCSKCGQDTKIIFLRCKNSLHGLMYENAELCKSCETQVREEFIANKALLENPVNEFIN